jgi:hypothetical protein
MKQYVICVENSFYSGKLSKFKVGKIYNFVQYNSLVRINLKLYEVLDDDTIWVDKNFYYEQKGGGFEMGIIKFEKYNYRKEKLERILNG